MKKVIPVIVLLVVLGIGLYLLISKGQRDGEASGEKAEKAADGAREHGEATLLGGDEEDEPVGTVVDGLKDVPLAATVQVMDGDRVVETVKCRANGDFYVKDVKPEYTYFASHPGYVTKGKRDVAHAREDADPISLWPEGVIEGHVVNVDAQGMAAGVQITYQKDSSGAKDYSLPSVDTAGNGVFAVHSLYAGIVNIEVSADGYQSEFFKGVTVVPGEKVELGEIQLHAGLAIAGTVSDAGSGDPIAGAILQTLDADGNVLMERTSGDDGSYRLTAALDAPVRIAVKADGYRDVYDTIEAGGDTVYTYDVAMSKLTGIAILVDNQTGREPIVTHVTVTDLATEKVVHDNEYENGLYSLDELREGPYQIRGVSPDGLSEAVVRAVAGSTSTLTLKPLGRLHVQFVTKTGSKAEGSYRYIYKANPDAEEESSGWSSFTDESFMIENLKAGSYWIEAQSDISWNKMDREHGDVQPHISRSHELPLEMGETRYVKLTLTTGSTLRGRVKLDPNRQDKGGFAIVQKLYPTEGRGVSMGISRADFDPETGEFFFDSMPEGEFNVIIQYLDGGVSYFSGINVDYNGDLAMDFDATHARNKSSSGHPLRLQDQGLFKTDAEKAKMTDAEKEEYSRGIYDRFTAWQEALTDQEQWQKDAARREQENGAADDGE